MFTVRLDPDLEKEFAVVCRLKRTTKAAAVTEMIRAYVRGKSTKKSPFELAEEMGLVGCVARAPATGRDHSRYLKSKQRTRSVR